jgi:hypothetical protein
VTVCVAAICESASILGASDRMLTSGDVQFEPRQTKIEPLTNSIAIMVAGDSAMQAEIIHNVRAVVWQRVAADPKDWWNLRDVAELYQRFYNHARAKRSENAVLAPLGLDTKEFLRRQREMEPQLVRELTSELLNYRAPSASAIVTGIDPSGPHLYISSNGQLNCQDSVGFASIGAGHWHANSQLMFAGHTRSTSFPETLLSVYSAKKRAEVAPGVGNATDMFAVASIGSYLAIGDHVLERLEQIYQDTQRRQQDAQREARESVQQYVEEIARTVPAEKQRVAPPETLPENPPEATS